jgi:hypothetical protein
LKLGAPPLCFCDNFLRRGTPQQSFHLFCSFLQIFSLLHVSYTNISLSQSLCHKVSPLVLSSTQSRIVSLYNLFCSWMKSLFWSYPLPRTECRHSLKYFSQSTVQAFSQSLTQFSSDLLFCICRCCQLNGQYETELFSLSLLHILSSCFVLGDVVSLVVSVRLSYFSFQLLHILSSCFVLGDVVSLVVSVKLSYFSFQLLHILRSCFVFGDVVSLMVCMRLSFF